MTEPDGLFGRLNGVAVVHAIACALQGLLLALFLDVGVEAAVELFLGFAAIGAVLTVVWRQWAAIPHWLDMCFSMFTVGSFGMYLGIWTDHRFGPVVSLESFLWTYAFMLVACNVAMFTMPRHRHRFDFTDVTFLSMLIGSNLGMIAGMKTGVLAVTWLVDAAKPMELVCKLAGMSLGMVGGMMLGSRVAMMLGCKVAGWLSKS